MRTRRVTVTELRNHASSVIDALSDGEVVLITRNGVDVAELRPVDQRPDARRRQLIEHLRSGQPIAEPTGTDDIDSLRATSWRRPGIAVDDRSGFPVMSFGRGRITTEDVAGLLEDE